MPCAMSSRITIRRSMPSSIWNRQIASIPLERVLRCSGESRPATVNASTTMKFQIVVKHARPIRSKLLDQPQVALFAAVKRFGSTLERYLCGVCPLPLLA